jgi:hypothetical protein
MIDRRNFLGIAAGAGASLALTPQLLRALQQSGGKLIQRAVPSTGEMLPVVSFDPQKESDNAGMKELLKTLLDNGGKVIDFPHGGGEEVARTAAAELGIHDKLFWTTPLSVPPANTNPVLPGAIRKVDPAAVRAAIEAKLAKFKAPILPLAMERKIGFMAHFTFDRGRLFQRASGTPLPEWAAEFDAKTWAQFFLKYVISHPAVIVARAGTTKAAHMLDNIGGGMGRLPNEAMRKRMAAFVDALPARQTPPAASSTTGRTVITSEQMQQQQVPSVVLSLGLLDRYVGEYKHMAAGTVVTIRRDGDKLLLNVHGSGRPEMSFVARSETRFASASIFSIEFQLDGQGKVTGATWETVGPPGIAPERIPLERK